MNDWSVPQVKLMSYRKLLAGEPIPRVTPQSSTQEGRRQWWVSFSLLRRTWACNSVALSKLETELFPQHAVIKTHLVLANICTQLSVTPILSF